MDTDLHHVIRANILEEVHKQYIMYQLLKSLKYTTLSLFSVSFISSLHRFMHTAEMLHRDMKPSNMLLNSDCLVKVLPFPPPRASSTQHSLY